MTKTEIENIQRPKHAIAYELRIKGLTFSEIAKEMGVTAPTARDYFFQGGIVVGNS
jgi:predicted transcriptional regulator